MIYTLFKMFEEYKNEYLRSKHKVFQKNVYPVIGLSFFATVTGANYLNLLRESVLPRINKDGDLYSYQHTTPCTLL